MWKVLRYELLRGLAYRSIKHPNARLYTMALPVVLTVIFLASYYALPIKPALVGKDGAFAAALSVLSTLPGFYFAGLAAIATFTNPTIDHEMQAPAPELVMMVQGRGAIKALTRRQFLSYLFSYLVIVSFVLCIELLFLNAASASIALFKSHVISVHFGPEAWQAIKLFAVTQIGLLAATLLATTLHGVFFLTERIHQP